MDPVSMRRNTLEIRKGVGALRCGTMNERMPIHPKEPGWRLKVELALRQELEPHRAHVRQPFWIGIMMADPERQSDVCQKVRQGIEALEIASPIVLRARIQAGS